MIVYVTKWALSKGVLEVDATIHNDGGISWGRYGWASHEGIDWHRDAASALARAVEMKKNRVASLKQQIAKIERLVSFEIVKVAE